MPGTTRNVRSPFQDHAWTEIETLLTGQWADDMVPHIVFHRHDDGYFPGPDVWRVEHQPPTLDCLASRGCTAGSRRRTGGAAIVHPWESGRDNSPAWDVGLANVDTSGVEPYERRDLAHVDAAMRPSGVDYDRYIALVQFGRSSGWDHRRIVADGPFLMADPALQFILLRGHRDLAALGRLLGESASADELDRWADDLQAAVPRLWNDGAYDSLDLRTGRFAGCVTASAWLEYWAGVADERVDARLADVWDRVGFGVPTHDPAAPGFEPCRYWRGPVWPVVNSLVGIGLAEQGRTREAERLRRETAALIDGGGFVEYFDPVDATPCGGDGFTWTAAVWLAWVRAGGSTVPT